MYPGPVYSEVILQKECPKITQVLNLNRKMLLYWKVDRTRLCMEADGVVALLAHTRSFNDIFNDILNFFIYPAEYL